jgi:outer membrane protein assembly factor BamB
LINASSWALLLSSASASDWPQWQGPDRNAVSKERGLLQEWPKDGPPLAWKATGIGKGMGGIAVSRGHIYTTGDDAQQTAWLYVLTESDGKPEWNAKIGPGGNPGNSLQAVRPASRRPAMDGDRLYILSQTGDLVCFTTVEGKEVWRVNYVKDLGGIMPVGASPNRRWWMATKIFCTPGATDATLMALDKRTGKPIWKCKVPEGPTGDPGFPWGRQGRPTHQPSRSTSKARVSTCNSLRRHSSGVAASDGNLLWRYDRASNTHRINCTTPLYHDGMVIAASAYDAGGGAGEAE